MNKKRLTIITAVVIILSILHICLDLTVGGFASDFTKGLPVVFLFVCMCFWGRKHPKVIFALMFSFLGDYAAETSLPGHTSFHLQIVFFAVAQICYILEFQRYCPARTRNTGKAMSLTPVLCAIYGLCALNGNCLYFPAKGAQTHNSGRRIYFSDFRFAYPCQDIDGRIPVSGDSHHGHILSGAISSQHYLAHT